MGLWYVEVQSGKSRRIDENYFAGFGPPEFTPAWSPDSQWIAYAKNLRSGQHAVFVYSLAQDKSFQVTDGMSDALYPVFDRNGKYLYFTASTDVALTAQGLDMSSNEHRVSRSVYVVVLSKLEPSPLPPQSDEEKAAAEKRKDEQDKNPRVGFAIAADAAERMQHLLRRPTKSRSRGRSKRLPLDQYHRYRPAHPGVANSSEKLRGPTSRKIRRAVHLRKERW